MTQSKKKLSIGQDVQRIREKRGLSAYELRSRTGVNVRRVELDEHTPNVWTLQRLADALDANLVLRLEDEDDVRHSHTVL